MRQAFPILCGYPYPLIFASMAGSHAFGYATDCSDFDVHGVHLLPLSHVLGFNAAKDETIERKVEGDPAIDLATHDLKKFLLLLIKGNGNILEDIFSPLILHTSPLHEELKVLARGCISKQCAAHYRGMAYNQQRRMQLNDVKKLLHCYRCLLMGIHLMKSGTLEMNVVELAQAYGYTQVQDIIAMKRSGIEGISQTEMVWQSECIESLYVQLESATQQSQLPERTPQSVKDELEQVLIRVRKGEG